MVGIKNRYYEKTFIQYEIIKACKKRDFSVLGNGCNWRGFSIFNDKDFLFHLNLINWNKNKQYLYRSCATLKSIPKFNFNTSIRKHETHDFYENKYCDYLEKYDLFFDFDKKDNETKQVLEWHEVIADVKEFKEWLENYEVPYILLFSGSKGFQIIISGDYIPIKDIKKTELQTRKAFDIYPHKKIVEDIKNNLRYRSLDLSNNGSASRLCKLPFSLALKEKIKEEKLDLTYIDESQMNVVLPLTDEQLNNFKVEQMNLNYVLSNIKLMNRGILERFENIDSETKKKNIEKFIKSFSFK